MSASPPILFDRALLRQRRNRAAASLPEYDFLLQRVIDDLLDRVESINRDFERVLVLGGGGVFGQMLAERPSAAAKIGTLIETDIAEKLARQVCVDEECLPFADESFDLVISPLALHWCNDLPGVLIQINRALKSDGFFAAAVFGGASLKELRQSMLAAETEIHGGASARVSPFADTMDMAGLLQRTGFAMPVTDVDRVTVRYGNSFVLMRDLRAMGETSNLAERSRRPVSKRFFVRTAEIYAERFAGDDGKIPATFEIIHAGGWAPHPDQPRPKRPGSATARLADALGVVENSAGEKAGR
ncbi:methyltransferase domain-containing protein [Hyphobacterium sp. HN65]|uniref:Methyltransferase domain-containing protein n=1 Tax=Hyphobacterium lacteum TaxID=3116575 RepID=A0ABU7LQ75_9PROT|nr:methyltransferase domain-containing protein [Hyphobacterium sp. HN65]MEE2526069.1 methyltransferase domain-containing protein [Hyphobacterium sp. HN65]